MDLNVILIILGVLALMILIGHGIWSNRREKTQFFKNAHTFTRDSRLEQSSIQNTSQLVSATRQAMPSEASQQGFDFDTAAESAPPSQDVAQIKITLPEDSNNAQSTYYNMPTSNLQVKDTPSIKLQEDGHIMARAEEPIMQAPSEKAHHPESHSETRQQIYVQTRQTEKAVEPSANPPHKQRTGNLRLYVVAAEGAELQGFHLVQALENLGLMYSEQGIFHRYFDTVASPILYSVANVRKPGTFDLNNLEQFSTVGIVLFMQLSNHIRNDQLNFNTMALDAEQLAKALGGFVLDEQQEIFSEQSKAVYQQKIQG